MPQNNPPEPLDNSTEAYDPTFAGLAKIFFFIDFAFLCLVEARVIHGLWFRHGVSSGAFAMYLVPIAVLFSGLMALASLMAVRGLSRKWRIHPTATGRIEQIISLVVFAAYVAMLELAEIAFH
jgi:hypothetical protein